MSKKLTITVDDEVYAGLHSVIGRRKISRFINDLARPHVLRRDLAEGYRAMAADREREREAAAWVKNPTARRCIDAQALRALTDTMPLQPEPAGNFVRRMRDGDRY
jgi:predicted CopG family antitoxin